MCSYYKLAARSVSRLKRWRNSKSSVRLPGKIFSVAAGQPRMLGQIDVTHPAGPQPSNDRVSRRPVRRCCQRFATCEHATEAATGSDRIIAAWLISEPDEIGG